MNYYLFKNFSLQYRSSSGNIFQRKHTIFSQKTPFPAKKIENIFQYTANQLFVSDIFLCPPPRMPHKTSFSPEKPGKFWSLKKFNKKNPLPPVTFQNSTLFIYK